MKILNISKKITLRDIYLEYPYKYRDILSSTIAVPYFPKEEVSKHKNKLTFKEWKKILLVYFKHLVIYLITTGMPYKIPNKLGLFQMKKYKSRNSPNWKKTKEVYGTTKTKPIMFKNIHTQGYKPILKWYRSNTQAWFKYKWYWRFKLSSSTWKLVSSEIFKDLTLINKLEQE